MPPAPADTIHIARYAAAAALVTAAVFFQPAAIAASVETVRVTGEARGTGPQARDAATADALERAVADVLGDAFGGDDSLVHAIMPPDPRHYVQAFEQLQHDQDGETTRVEVEARVLARALKADAASAYLGAVYRKPRILLLVTASRENGARAVDPAVERAVAEACAKPELELLTFSALREWYSEEDVLARLHSAERGPQQLGLEMAADSVLVAHVAVKSSNSGGSVITTSAEISGAVYRPGEQSAACELRKSAEITSANAAEGAQWALRRAAGVFAADAMVAAILVCAGYDAPDDAVVMTLSRLETEDELAAVLEYLKIWEGGATIDTVALNGENARLVLRYGGEIDRLVEALTLRDFAGFRLRARSVVGQEMSLELAH